MSTAAPSSTTTEDLLAECAALADTLDRAEAVKVEAYERRTAVWAELVARDVNRQTIADRSRVGQSAIRFVLHKARKRERVGGG